MNRLIRKLPSADYSWIRRRILTLDLSPCGSRGSSEPTLIAVDSSGVSVHKSGGWVTRVHGKKKRYIKVHFAVDVKTKEVVAMEVTTDDAHDSEALPAGLIKRLDYEGWAGTLATVDAGLLKQRSQHSNASTENTAWLKTWKA